jgi:osmotically-inducible protein OsmY
LNVPGFDDRKQKLRGYLNWLEIEGAELTPAERDLSERVLRALSDDPVAGAILVRVTASDGVVRLFSLSDTDAAQRDRAVEVARAVPGVVFVEDDMR